MPDQKVFSEDSFAYFFCQHKTFEKVKPALPAP
jgi:hypothetical protein